jgi:tetratricopeptide (TPR) repeat protein
MKRHLILLLLGIPFVLSAQQYSYAQWQKEARINKRLLPKYGQLPKSKTEKEADQAFVDQAIKADTTASKASERMVNKGFELIDHDLKEAMYSFNQAYLLDSTNTNIYLGYGSVYEKLNQPQMALNYYMEGLDRDQKNGRLLMASSKQLFSTYLKSKDTAHLNKAIDHWQLAKKIIPENYMIDYHLASSYLIKNDCKLAQKHYQDCINNGGAVEAYQLMTEIKSRCQGEDK